MSSKAILVRNLSKKFGVEYSPAWKHAPRLGKNASGWMRGDNERHGQAQKVVAVDQLSFSVAPGEIFGVLGPSGSGKSTLIRMLATLLVPDSGELYIFGLDVVRQPLQVQRLINRVSVEASFYKTLSPIENLVRGARLNGASARAAGGEAVEVLARLGLDESSFDKPMAELSRATQQKVSIARALLPRPRLLLLDEPVAGLDQHSRLAVYAVLRELRAEYGTTILLTAHDLPGSENLYDRVAILKGGKMVALDTPKNLLQGDTGSASRINQEEEFLSMADVELIKEIA